MKSLVLAMTLILLAGSTAYADWCAGPVVGYSYYAPVAYPAPVYVARHAVVYAPAIVPAPVVYPAPVYVARPVVIGPTGKVYIPGRPVRNAVRAVIP